MRKILSLCDFSGNILKPWAYAGFECIAVDIANESTNTLGKITYVKGDVRDFEPPSDVAACFAFPPCTHLAISGARHFKKKGLRALSEAIDIFGACVEIIESLGVPGFVENPVSTISTYYRPYDYYFHPYFYGDPYAKKTCLWTYNGFIMPPTTHDDRLISTDMIHNMSSKNSNRERSYTPKGFCEAVYLANKDLIWKSQQQ